MKKGIKLLAVTGAVIGGMAIILMIIIALSVNDVRRAYRNSENAIDVIVNELQHGKIAAIGEGHEQVNEELFIANNIEALYDAGVRYIFVEGGGTLESSLPSNDEYFFCYVLSLGGSWLEI